MRRGRLVTPSVTSAPGRDGAAGGAAGEEAPAEEGALERPVAVHPAAAEPGDLTRRIQAGQGSPSARSTRLERSVCSPPNVFRVTTDSRTAISGPLAGSRNLCGAAVRMSLSPRYLPGAVDRRDLGVLGEGVVELAVAFGHLPLDSSASSGASGVSEFIRSTSPWIVVAVTKSSPWSRSPAPVSALRGGPGQHLADRLAGEVGVLLRAGEGELLLDHLLGQDEPRVVVAGLAQVGQRAEGVEAREVRRGEPTAVAVEPHRRRSGQDPDGVTRPDRRPVVDALDVVPHPVAVDDRAAGPLDDPDHPPVDVGGDTGRQVVGRRAEPVRPGRPYEVVVATDPAAT